jgi:hypothetical protein
MRPASGTTLTNATRLAMNSTFMSPTSNLRSTSWMLLFLPWAEPTWLVSYILTAMVPQTRTAALMQLLQVLQTILPSLARW